MASRPPSSRTGPRTGGRGSSTRAGGRGAAAGRRPVRKRRRDLPWGLIAASTALAAFVVGIVAYSALHGGSSSDPGKIDGVQTFKFTAGQHRDSPISYPQTPPAGGPHKPVPQTCGIYTSPVPNENAVHSMEHGAVWLTYQPELPASDVAQLTKLVKGSPYELLSPYPGLPAPVVASAWGKQVRLTSPRDPRLQKFIDAYSNGPQNPEPGAQCTGTGNPVG